MALNPRQRTRKARIAAHASWANTADRQGRTAQATASFLARFEKQVDPLGVLEPEVRAKMAEHARRAYMLQLAERSAKARSRAKAGEAGGRSSRRDEGSESWNVSGR
ncbi:hypothetical protein ACFQFC_35255 [Amorphoplanes digitatis]|uniref:Uncharacterized protein n=1 Tax=Actinoplanes digitatis TaxID=1868 RepID=A0A7W7MP79_9ACTN|nr:hypothetical protein [Actinoplanes digitatis]MBB4761422.1 hypothetical protein [Actinoplanes digitatis]